MSMSELSVGLQRVFVRAGDAAVRELDGSSIANLVHEVDGLLPGNGMDEPFRMIESILQRGRVVDVLGRPARTPGVHAVVVEDADAGARLLAMLRHGRARDLAAEQFFTDVAVASGAEDLVAPMAMARDGRSSLVQLIPASDLRGHGIDQAAQLERVLAHGYEVEGLNPARAAHEARVDREIAASLDAITGHADRHGGNAILDADAGRLTLIDHELVGCGGFYAAQDGAALLDPLLQGGGHGVVRSIQGERVALRSVQLSDDALDQLADMDLAAVARAHERLAASTMLAGGEMADWIRSPEYRDWVIDRVRQIVVEGGWDYIPVG